MPDLVVTVPQEWWSDWLQEGQLAGEPESGIQWGFRLGHRCPPIGISERLYVVSHGRLRGYAPVTGVVFLDDHGVEHMKRPDIRPGVWVVGRRGGAVAVTIPRCFSRFPAEDKLEDTSDMAYIRGFRGFVERWWPRVVEKPFPDWKTRDLFMHQKLRRQAAAELRQTESQRSCRQQMSFSLDEK